ncbi:AFR699Cp [Eremothecium gossypii ATCC 10895]|uniref:AFR699Cp n=1 Tax=Eremothecium gossypii (strain ATCC 10895 / CBS 109.51 / FGSC 9923 / NRRL Y-1056) TaxID=284811 RepID=Q751X6_EREGS|nr:AFR699Cp [Eremothecium gossypii ATCC 10895]AAS54071.1 AFR699Cp [Eremothecium gossypii ATCC 10895]AEY98386.1 FAFR699Cp [Eremothecium gossypii FDAG1]
MAETDTTVSSTITKEVTVVFYRTSSSQEEDTILQTVTVDKYYASGQTIPYAYSTLSSQGGSTIYNLRSTPIQPAGSLSKISATESASAPSFTSTTSLKYSTVTSSSDITLPLATSMPLSEHPSGTEAASEQTPTYVPLTTLVSNEKSSKTIICLSIGLPIAIFVVSIALILWFFRYRSTGRHRNEGKPPRWAVQPKTMKTQRPRSLDLEKEPLGNDYKDSQIYDNSGIEVQPPHVLTPDKAALNPETSDSDTMIEKYLYGKPNLGSKLADTQDRTKWTYESPLSRWFLTKSVYQPFSSFEINSGTTEIKTPTVPLKTLRILSKVRREQAPNPQTAVYSPFKEEPVYTSAMVASMAYNSQTSDFKPPGTSVTEKVSTPTSKMTTLLPLPDTPLDETSSYKENSYDTSPELEPAQYSHSTPVVPSPPPTADGDLCVVIKPFSPRLLDEIELNIDEQVRVLARHTDGWCLVEKCDSAKSADSDSDNISAPNYLNERRGIVPQMCLKHVFNGVH